MRNHEVTKKQLLLDGKGKIAEPGWARSMLWEYRRSQIKAPKFKIKEWDYYLVQNDKYAAAFTISDDGYVGLQSVSLLNLGESPWEHTETILDLFPMGKLHMPESTTIGDVSYHKKRLDLDFIKKEHERRIRCEYRNFYQGKTFTCDIKLEQPDMDTMVIATPWDKTHAFYYNQKINCMRASGYMEFDGVRYDFRPECDFGILDWGRGVWTYDNTWNWGSMNCDLEGKVFGFNIGYGFGNTLAATENILFYEGKAHKLDDVEFCIPSGSYMDTWTFTSSDGRFEMEFVPVLDRMANMNFGLILSDQHQVFGRISGKAILDDGTVLDIRDKMCFAERVHNKY